MAKDSTSFTGDLDSFGRWQVLAPETPHRAAVLETRTPPPVTPEEPPDVREVVSDLRWLVPAFRERVEAMLDDLRVQGYEPRVWETLRTPARARWLLAKGSSRNGDRSMHLYGAAVDVICREHKWSCTGKADHGFWTALGAAARRQRLTSGGSWKSLVDRPHVQAVPVSMQSAVRSAEDPARAVSDYLYARAPRPKTAT